MASSPSPEGGGHRRPSAAVLCWKNADAKHRLWSDASRGGVAESQRSIVFAMATPTRSEPPARIDLPPAGGGEESARCNTAPHESSTHVSFVPPPWLELTTSEPFFR